jgi:hypothetical protein
MARQPSETQTIQRSPGLKSFDVQPRPRAAAGKLSGSGFSRIYCIPVEKTIIAARTGKQCPDPWKSDVTER